MPYDANGNWTWDDEPPAMGSPYPDYDIFGPANTGDIIGNTGPGYGFDNSMFDPPYVFRGDPTYGTPDDRFGPANTGDIITNTGPGYGLGDRPSDPNSWYRRLGRGALDVLKNTRPGGGPPGQGQNSNVLPAIARILQGLSKGRAEGRITEAEMARLYDYLNLARTRTFYDRAGQELDQRKFAQDLQERSYGNAARASALQNYTRPAAAGAPAAIAPFVGTPHAGLEAIPQGTRNEIGGAMYRNAITELLDPLQPGTATTGRRMAALPEPEPISPTPEAGRFDDILNWASIIMGGLYPTQTTPNQQQPQQQQRPREQPPAAIDPYRSGPSATSPRPDTNPSLQPGYIGDVNTGAPGRAELSRSSLPADSGMAAAASAGLNTDAGLGRGLPPISDMVGAVPGPVSPISPYDPYARLRTRRA